MEELHAFMSSDDFDRRGFDLYESGNIDAALKTYEEGLDLFPFTPELHSGRGHMYLYLGEFVQAFQAFGSGLILNPLDPELNKGAGIALCYLNRVNEAMQYLQWAIPHFKDDEHNLFDISMALYQACRFDEALALLDEIAMASPVNPDAHFYRALALHQVGGRTAEVREAFKAALTCDPDRIDVAENFANVLYECGLYSEALEVFERFDSALICDELLLERMIDAYRKFRGTRRKRWAVKRRLREIRSISEVDAFIEDLEQEWKAALG